MFSPKITTTCLMGDAVGTESDSALAVIGLATVLKTSRADNEVARYFCISTPPRRGRYLREVGNGLGLLAFIGDVPTDTETSFEDPKTRSSLN
jgi:hypothetical protein